MTSTPPGTILTVGHSNHSIERFSQLLGQHDVTLVTDVRSVPYSRRNPDFNREQLGRALEARGLAYLFLGDEVGARPRDPSCYVNGRVDYRALASSRGFRRGLERLMREAETQRVAVLCAEKEPLNCHRTLLIARELRTLDVDVAHILADGTLEGHDQAMERLLDQLKLRQLDLFGGPIDRFEAAYAKQEQRIAFTVDAGDDSDDAEGAV
jgi:uncharacterized protein (DUF488 family)